MQPENPTDDAMLAEMQTLLSENASPRELEEAKASADEAKQKTEKAEGSLLLAEQPIADLQQKIDRQTDAANYINRDIFGNSTNSVGMRNLQKQKDVGRELCDAYDSVPLRASPRPTSFSFR